MNRLLSAFALALLAAAPAPLIVGSVRDQNGAPIARAEVRLPAGPATRTAADGTFALNGDGRSVEIRCDYCAPTRASVAADGTVVAIVHRYDAVRVAGPSAADISNLPYARAESVASLTPFVVLETSGNPFVGASLHDRSISTPGGLLVVDGVPDYDSAGGGSTWGTLPYASTTSVNAQPATDGGSYGGTANSGTFAIGTFGGGTTVGAGAQNLADYSSQYIAAGASSDGDDRRARAAAQLPFALPDATGTLAVASASQSDDIDPRIERDAFSSVNASYERTEGTDIFADVLADRGTSTYGTPRYASDDTWSDVEEQAGIRSRAVVAPFLEADARQTNGWYWDPDEGAVAGTIRQTRLYGGVNVELPWLSARLLYGNDGVYYAEGAYGAPVTANGRDASVALDLHPLVHWDLDASSSSGYIVQTLAGYEGAPVSPLDPTSTNEAELTYRDLSRLRIGATAFQTRSASGVDDTSAGLEAAWQIAPAVSLRSWWLQVHPQNGAAQSVGSAWLTTTSGVTQLDLIWRRDLLDLTGRSHLDGAFSAPLGTRLRWMLVHECYARSCGSGVRLRI
jgi:hypothetical protein